jgi:hypothetical protein
VAVCEDHFQLDNMVELQVPGREDNSRAAVDHFIENLVARERFAGRRAAQEQMLARPLPVKPFAWTRSRPVYNREPGRHPDSGCPR